MRLLVALTDPLHVGHIRHLQLAKQLGDMLIVLVSNDEDMIRKKGYCFMPLAERMEILRALSCVDMVIPTIDKDGTQTETLKSVKADIFVKGGDRSPFNMPQGEIDTCKEIGCKIVYGIGEQIQSSSYLVERLKNGLEAIRGNNKREQTESI